MSIKNVTRSAIVAAALGSATGTMLAVLAPPGWAQSVPGAISIDNFTFKPQTLTVKAGTTITWTNKDDIPHAIASKNNAFGKSRALDTDNSYSSRLLRLAHMHISATFIRI
jgi:plastocyanin